MAESPCDSESDLVLPSRVLQDGGSLVVVETPASTEYVFVHAGTPAGYVFTLYGRGHEGPDGVRGNHLARVACEEPNVVIEPRPLWVGFLSTQSVPDEGWISMGSSIRARRMAKLGLLRGYGTLESLKGLGSVIHNLAFNASRLGTEFYVCGMAFGFLGKVGAGGPDERLKASMAELEASAFRAALVGRAGREVVEEFEAMARTVATEGRECSEGGLAWQPHFAWYRVLPDDDLGQHVHDGTLPSGRFAQLLVHAGTELRDQESKAGQWPGIGVVRVRKQRDQQKAGAPLSVELRLSDELRELAVASRKR